MRRIYTEEFKRDAVALVTEQGYRVTEAARSLPVHDSLLRKWRRNFAAEAYDDGLSVSERDDATRLRKEVRTLRMEKEILKSQPVFCQGNEVRYWCIHSHARDYPVAGLWRLLQIQRSAYYAWRKRQSMAMSVPELALRQRMRVLFQASRASMDSRRMLGHTSSPFRWDPPEHRHRLDDYYGPL